MARGDRFNLAAGQVKLDASGGGQVTLTPPDDIAGWIVTLTSVNVTTRNAEPTFRLYRGNAMLNFIEGSHSGSQDSSDSVLRIAPGESLVGVWEGGDPGATASLRCSGEVA